jgi:magnesium-transporting ATPase (P-type)
LTGEVDAIEISIEPQSKLAMEAKNLAFNSCLCMEGSAYGIVYATGDNTLIGCIARMTAAPKIGNYIIFFLIVFR